MSSLVTGKKLKGFNLWRSLCTWLPSVRFVSVQFEESMTPIYIVIKSDWRYMSCEYPISTCSCSMAHVPTWEKMISWTQCSDLFLTKTLRLNSLYESQFFSPQDFPYPKIILPILMDRWVPPQQQVPQFCHFWAAGRYHSAVKQLSRMSIRALPHGSQLGCLLIWTLNRMVWSSEWQAQLARASQ